MTAPAPTAADRLRTLRVALVDVPRMLLGLTLDGVRPRPSTTTEPGLAAVRASFSATLRHLGVALEVRRGERVPRTGGLTFMWNQESHLDHLVLAAAIPRPFFSIYNNAVARVPLYGAHMRRAGHVHVNRHDEAQWRPALARAAARVRAGECVLVSPEGTRSRDGSLLPLKRGALTLACQAAAPIVCVTVIGGHERMPLGSSIVRAGPLRVAFSEPLDPPAGDDEAAHDALRARLVDTFTATKTAHALCSEGRPLSPRPRRP